jgi:predicted enzyme related to lactoylglutathione lyase
VLSSRVLLRPANFERSFQFYSQTLDLHVYREWGSGSTRGVVFFLGGGFLELSGSSDAPSSEKVSLWLQVRDVKAVGWGLEDSGVDMVEAPVDKPWGLREMRVQDPEEASIVLVRGPKEHLLRHP